MTKALVIVIGAVFLLATVPADARPPEGGTPTKPKVTPKHEKINPKNIPMPGPQPRKSKHGNKA